jgi:membrane protease YdiL (CAAX protease family)
MIGMLAMLPAAFHLGGQQMSAELEKKMEEAGINYGILGALMVVQLALYIAGVTCLGLWASRKLGLRAPLTEAIVLRQPIGPVLRDFALVSILGGAFVGVAVVLLDVFIFEPLSTPVEGPVPARPAIWMGALMSLDGGLTEELICRLMLMSLLALLLRWMARVPEGLPDWAAWAAIALAAILFSLGHLPALAATSAITPVAVAKTLVLNGLVAGLAGWLYWKRGLESAMLAHWVVDLILHVIASPLLGAFGQ